MIYKKMAKFFFIGLLFVGVPSIYAMENDKILADSNTSKEVREQILRQRFANLTEQQLEELLEDPCTPQEVRSQILRQREANQQALQDARVRAAKRDEELEGMTIDEKLRTNAAWLKAKKDAAQKEEQRLNELILDPNTPKDVRAQLLRQREANKQAFRDARDTAARRDDEIQRTCLVQ